MKAFLTRLRDITISGILALLPLYVFLLVISKAWKSLSSIGTGVAQMLGMKSILGVGGATVFSGLLIVAKAEEKLQNKVRVLPYASALIRWEDCWQPAYIVEQDQEGNCVVFLPEIPETNKGHVLLARQDQVRIVESMTANQLDASLKKAGRGLLSDYGIHTPPDRRAIAG